MYHPRTIKEPWLKASKEFPVLLLTGPRQVGKTTFLQHICEKDRRYVTLDDPGIRALANDDPALFLQRFRPPVLIDEIQYAPKLLPYVKMAVDSDRKPGVFWLTGSQQFQMMKGVSETLAGRVAIVNMLGFSNRERHKLALDVPPFLPTNKDLAEREKSAGKTRLAGIYKDIWLGSFPAMVAGPVKDRDVFYGSYLQTYLQRDVRDLAQVGNEAGFLRFVKACAARTAQMLNVAELARDADVSVNTAKAWLSILQASFQVFLLPPYHTNVTKRLVKAPKLYFLDTGLCAYLTEWSSPQTLEAGAMGGAIFETHAFVEIVKSWWHRMRTPPLYYYRDKDGREVDFLFVQDRRFHPVEAKKSATPKSDWTVPLASLKRFSKEVGEGGVVCLSPQRLPLGPKANAIPVGLI
ncbi:MAG: ATP-binding protein [Planctomycetota bacterium]|nr:ATP-binding protein [Planctomycetota bacterium]